MKRLGLALLIGLIVLSFALTGCAGKSNGGTTSSPSAATSPDTSAAASASVSASANPSAVASPSAAPSPSAVVSPSAAPSPSVSAVPDGFVMGKVTAIAGTQITLNVINPVSTKTITADANTAVSISGSTKSAALTDIVVGDVITATLSGTTALKIIDDGPNIDPDPSAYISPSPSPSTEASPSAS